MITQTKTLKIFVMFFGIDGFTEAGEWIDVDQDVEILKKRINENLIAMSRHGATKNISLRASYAIYDYENFLGVEEWLGEYPSLDLVAKAAGLIQQEGQLGAYWVNLLDGNINKAVETFEDAYAGSYKNLEDFVKEINEGQEIPIWLKWYIDWESMGQDLIFNGEIFVIETGFNEVHVFWNNC